MTGRRLVLVAAVAICLVAGSAGATLGALIAPGAEPFHDWRDFIELPLKLGAMSLTLALLLVVICVGVSGVMPNRRRRWLRLVRVSELIVKHLPVALGTSVALVSFATLSAASKPGIWLGDPPHPWFFRSLLCSAVLALLSGVLCRRLLQNWARAERVRAERDFSAHCVTCGYPRAGRGVCPECGRPAPPAPV